MAGIGEGIAFASLVAAAVVLEISDKSAGGLWFIIIVWVIWTDWGQK